MSTVVIYEEDRPMRALLEEWLNDAGYCATAVAHLDRASPDRADLVIVSVYRPKDAGAQLIREAHEIHPGAPLIAISSQFRAGLSAAGTTAQALGAQRVIAIPLTREELLSAVRDMIGVPNLPR